MNDFQPKYSKRWNNMECLMHSPDNRVLVYYDRSTNINPYKVYTVINGRRKQVTAYGDFVSCCYTAHVAYQECRSPEQFYEYYAVGRCK